MMNLRFENFFFFTPEAIPRPWFTLKHRHLLVETEKDFMPRWLCKKTRYSDSVPRAGCRTEPQETESGSQPVQRTVRSLLFGFVSLPS